MLIVFVTGLNLQGQEKTGIVNSNYHPVSSVFLNPSTSADSRVYMQVNLAGINLFAMTNAAYIPSFSLLPFILHPAIPSSVLPYESKNKKYLFANLVADGPSFFISRDNFGAGIFVRARSVLDARRMPYQFVSLLFDNSGSSIEPQPFAFRNAKMANMSWLEYGGNFSYLVVKDHRDLVSAGISIKYLTGLNLQYLNFSDIVGDYTQSGITVNELQGKYRAAPFVFRSGKGYSADLGISYKKTLKQVDNYKAHNPNSSSRCLPVDYKYKLSLSLRDIGYVAFSGATSVTDLSGSGSIQSGADIQTSFEQQFSTENSNGTAIRAFLPAAVTAQGEYNFENGIYLNATLNKGVLPNSFIGVQSSDFLAIVPRFETRPVEISLPFTLQRFMNPHVGLGLRFRSFVFGVDNLVPLVLRRNTSSVGVYINLGFSIFRNPRCGAGSGGVDDCGKFKAPQLKFKRKNSLVSYRPLKEKRHRPQLIRKKRKVFKRK